MSPKHQSAILNQLDKNRRGLAHWFQRLARPARESIMAKEARALAQAERDDAEGWDLATWYRTYRRPSEEEQLRLHGEVIGAPGSAIAQVGVLPDELAQDWPDLAPGRAPVSSPQVPSAPLSRADYLSIRLASMSSSPSLSASPSP